MRPVVYHTALQNPHVTKPETAAEADRVTVGKCTALAHDVMEGSLPAEFDRCDAIYAEPPWPAGMKEFDCRVGLEGRKYKEFAEAIQKILDSLAGKPVVIMGGTRLQRYITVDRVEESSLHVHKVKCMAFVNGPVDKSIDFTSSLTIVKTMAQVYDCIGDFCCGYGYVGRIFRAAGKGFVLSDYNRECIGYIKSWLEQGAS